MDTEGRKKLSAIIFGKLDIIKYFIRIMTIHRKIIKT